MDKQPECTCTAEKDFQDKKKKEELEKPYITILHAGGVLHSSDCAITKQLRLPPEVEKDLYEKFREYDRVRNRAWAEACNYVIG